MMTTKNGIVLEEKDRDVSGGAKTIEDYCLNCEELMKSVECDLVGSFLMPGGGGGGGSTTTAGGESTAPLVRIYQTQAILPNPTKTIISVQEFPISCKDQLLRVLEETAKQGTVLHTQQDADDDHDDDEDNDDDAPLQQVVLTNKCVHWKVRYAKQDGSAIYFAYPSYPSSSSSAAPSSLVVPESKRFQLFPTCDRVLIKEDKIVLECISTSASNKHGMIGCFNWISDYINAQKSTNSTKARAKDVRQRLYQKMAAATPEESRAPPPPSSPRDVMVELTPVASKTRQGKQQKTQKQQNQQEVVQQETKEVIISTPSLASDQPAAIEVTRSSERTTRTLLETEGDDEGEEEIATPMKPVGPNLVLVPAPPESKQRDTVVAAATTRAVVQVEASPSRAVEEEEVEAPMMKQEETQVPTNDDDDDDNDTQNNDDDDDVDDAATVEMHEEIKSILQEVDPEQAEYVDVLLMQFRGREDELLESLRQIQSNMPSSTTTVTSASASVVSV